MISFMSVDYSTFELRVRFESLDDMRKAADGLLNDRPVVPKSEMDRQIKLLMNAGQKIEAIRYYRNLTGAYLMDSKKYVEQFEQENS